MSIDYYATRSATCDQAIAIVDGKDESLPLTDLAGIRSALLRIDGLTAEGPSDLNQLMWGRDGYIQVTLHDHCVVISHGGGAGDLSLAALESTMDTLKCKGLYIYDPQTDEILDGPTSSDGRSDSDSEFVMVPCKSCGDRTIAWICIHCEDATIGDQCRECHGESAHEDATLCRIT